MTIGRFTVMSIHTYIRRYALFLTGVILSATGIAFITRAGLGTSPVSGLPFVLSLITSISMGTYTFIFNMTFLMLEAILRRKFTIQQALQIPVTFFFGFCIDTAMGFIPTRFGGPWGPSFVYLVIGCIIMALGISFEKTGIRFGNVKVAFDSTLTILAMVVALIAFHKLNGVREGTLINALCVGQLVRLWRSLIEVPLKKLCTAEPAAE